MSEKRTRLTARRKELGLTQDELRELVGLRSKNSVPRWEKGETSPNAGHLKSLAEALEVPLAELPYYLELGSNGDRPKADVETQEPSAAVASNSATGASRKSEDAPEPIEHHWTSDASDAENRFGVSVETGAGLEVREGAGSVELRWTKAFPVRESKYALHWSFA